MINQFNQQIFFLYLYIFETKNHFQSINQSIVNLICFFFALLFSFHFGDYWYYLFESNDPSNRFFRSLSLHITVIINKIVMRFKSKWFEKSKYIEQLKIFEAHVFLLLHRRCNFFFQIKKEKKFLSLML